VRQACSGGPKNAEKVAWDWRGGDTGREKPGPSQLSCQSRLPGSAKLCLSVRRRRARLGGRGGEGKNPKARGGGGGLQGGRREGGGLK
jgi:hypothetical protein